MKQKDVISNLIWRFAERCGAQGVSFIVSIVLARILLPEAYGTIALVTIFTTVLNVFVDSGLGNALVQKKDADDLDFSSVFYFNLVACSLLYLLLFACAPWIAQFYDRPELVLLIRVLSLRMIISGINNIQLAYVSRTMQFKCFFYATLGGTIGAAVVGIGMAYLGFGVWALVGQSLFNATLDTIILWNVVKWHPKKMFSLSRLKGLFSYGSKLLASALIDTVYNNLSQLLIGKVYTTTDLAYYNKGQQLPNLIITNINTSIDSVLLPTLSKVQDEQCKVKDMTRLAIRTSSYIIWPAMIGLAVCAEPLITILLTEKWLPCVPFLQLYCISYALWPVHTANLNAIKALGRSDIFLKLEIIKKIIGVLVIAITLPIGVFAMAVGVVVTGPISAIVNAWPNKKLLGYSNKEQLADLLPAIALSCVMGICIWLWRFVVVHPLFLLSVQVASGLIVYLALSILFKISTFALLKGQFVKILQKKEKKDE